MGDIIKRSERAVRRAEKKRLRAEIEIVTQMPILEADPTKPYVPPVPYDVYSELDWKSKRGNEGWLALGTLGAIPMLGVEAGIGSLIGESAAVQFVSAPVGFYVMILGLIAPVISFSIQGARVQRKRVRNLRFLRERIVDNFELWVKQRYGATVDASNSYMMADTLMYGLGGEPELQFEDVNGERLSLIGHTKGFTVAKTAVRVERPQAALAVPEIAMDLPGESRLLHGHILTRLEVLKTKTMDETQQHTVDRVKTDMVDTLAAWQGLTELGEPDAADEAALTETFTVLNDELVRLVQALKTQAKRELGVQRNYVTNRDLRNSVSAEILDLEQGEQVTPKAVES